MFESALRPTEHTKPEAISAALFLQGLLLGTVLIAPLLFPSALPPLDLPLPKVPAPRVKRVMKLMPVPPSSSSASPLSTAPSLTRRIAYTPQSRISPQQALVAMSEAPAESTSGAETDGLRNGLPGLAGLSDVLNQVKAPERAKTEPAKQEATKPSVLRVSSGAQAARLLHGPRPVYPRLAIQTRTEGTIRLEAMIGVDGTIRQLRVVSGHPLLAPAALAAVETWRYQPTLLNGVAVSVATTIEVNFRLAR
jgi:periplasmic protein TonB